MTHLGFGCPEHSDRPNTYRTSPNISCSRTNLWNPLNVYWMLTVIEWNCITRVSIGLWWTLTVTVALGFKSGSKYSPCTTVGISAMKYCGRWIKIVIKNNKILTFLFRLIFMGFLVIRDHRRYYVNSRTLHQTFFLKFLFFIDYLS